MTNPMQDPERQRQDDEQAQWEEHYGHVRELEALLDEMNVPHHKIKERTWTSTKSRKS